MRYLIALLGVLFAIANVMAYCYEPIPSVPFIPLGMAMLGGVSGIGAAALLFVNRK